MVVQHLDRAGGPARPTRDRCWGRGNGVRSTIGQSSGSALLRSVGRCTQRAREDQLLDARWNLKDSNLVYCRTNRSLERMEGLKDGKLRNEKYLYEW